jgi:hypothetical protein
MNWSMPRPVLQVVATGIVVASLASFALGVATAPSRGRLPGERVSGESGTVLEATEATPLVDERIQGAAVEELTEEEKAALEAEKKAKAEAAALAKAEAEKGAPAGPEAAAAVGTAPAAPAAPAPKAEAAPAPAPQPKVEEPVF